ncbi:hypothetical protein [Acidithiobacillus thiooxidans]|uniref:Uncharacterized protein n=2 Tax=Acidithiobacillus thiooxidans TaxID=930 RepID=A0A1C2I1K5_ACITH|nr:hypothetical protein [Acidithiobacillus thiooxidans]MDX5933783.1 hypothetical protein [Acidithiobacillus thiooxidans]OCX69906.1 hypothetical protein A6M23_14800 [Acidithiobacillus thiooxidans]OCX78955.1 hypothetical protein A6P08_18745 [Acidithiobacillus thiooxidans]TQN52000.1 hypothetical protein DLNHIDIE_01881 [Acidithiobacillus thiooxidans ATCC 19377]
MDSDEKNRLRQRRWQENRALKGDKRINVYLSPEAFDHLESITQIKHWTKREAIEFALKELANHVTDD